MFQATNSDEDERRARGKPELLQWLQENELTERVYRKLKNVGIDSVKVLSQCSQFDADEISQQCNLTIGEKLKLRNAVSELAVHNASKQYIISEAEQASIAKVSQMIHKLSKKEVQNSATLKQIVVECATAADMVNASVSELMAILQNRQEYLLNAIATILDDKRSAMSQSNERIAQHLNKCRSVLKTANLMIKKPIEVEEMQARKQEIKRMCKDVIAVNIGDENENEIDNNCGNIHVVVDSMNIKKQLSTYGLVYDSMRLLMRPSLMALALKKMKRSANSKGLMVVEMKWKMNERFVGHATRLRIEWIVDRAEVNAYRQRKALENNNNNNNNHSNDNGNQWHVQTESINVEAMHNDNANITRSVIRVERSGIYSFRICYLNTIVNKWSQVSDVVIIDVLQPRKVYGHQSKIANGIDI